MAVEVKTLYPVWTNNLPLHNFMLQDLVGSVWAVMAFAVVLYAPGYILAWATDLFGFRHMDFADRSLWSVAASVCTVPVIAYLIGRGTGLSGIGCACVLSSVLCLALLWRSGRLSGWSRQDKLVTALIVGGWTTYALLMLVDFQAGHKLYFSVVMADQSYRIAFTDAVVRGGVPPANPLYFAGSPGAMRYYYFWYVLCATVVKVAHVSSRQAFIASSIWAGFSLMATVSLFTRHFFRWQRKQRWLALGLLLVMGADLVPSLGNAVLQPSINGDIEWWSVDPIDAWPDSLLWVPHHVVSVCCCLLAFLFLWRTVWPHPEDTTARPRTIWSVAFAGLAFASAFGLSVYVAFGFVLMVLAWLLLLFFQRQQGRDVLLSRVALAAIISAAAIAPFLWELVGSLARDAAATVGSITAPAAPTTHIFSLSVRQMIDSGLLTGLPVFDALNRAHPVLLDQGIRLLLLLPGLAMELGLYGAVLVLLLIARHRQELPSDPARDTAIFFTVTGLVMSLFLSSSVISNNDFGYRAVMLPQFFLLLLAADLLGSWWTAERTPVIAATPVRRRWIKSLLWLGIAGTVYGAFLLRAWLPLVARQSQYTFSDLPQDAFQIRTAFAALDQEAPANAVVAFRPIDPETDRQQLVMTPNEFYQRMLVMDAGRQLLNAEGKCATHFGGDPRPCLDIQQSTSKLYALPAPNAASAIDYCRRFGVQYLTISHHDPDWTATSGWPVTLPVIAQQPSFRVLQCVARN